jgi:hypothetical protein
MHFDDLFHIRLMQVIKSDYFTLLVCLKIPKTTTTGYIFADFLCQELAQIVFRKISKYGSI